MVVNLRYYRELSLEGLKNTIIYGSQFSETDLNLVPPEEKP
jgi:hypothetical protein